MMYSLQLVFQAVERSAMWLHKQRQADISWKPFDISMWQLGTYSSPSVRLLRAQSSMPTLFRTRGSQHSTLPWWSNRGDVKQSDNVTEDLRKLKTYFQNWQRLFKTSIKLQVDACWQLLMWVSGNGWKNLNFNTQKQTFLSISWCVMLTQNNIKDVREDRLGNLFIS